MRAEGTHLWLIEQVVAIIFADILASQIRQKKN
jgi:hypothetical protein